jgi:hypothetical protein
MAEMDVSRMVPGRTYRVAFRRHGEAFILDGRYVGREFTPRGETIVFAESLPLADGILIEDVIDVYELPTGMSSVLV